MKLYLYIAKFLDWWGKQKLLPFVLIAFAIYLIIINIIYHLLSLFIESIDTDSQYIVNSHFSENPNFFWAFIFLCIAAPFSETLLFQNVLIRLIRRYISKKTIWQIFLSGLCFGLIHHFNLYYIAASTIIGSFFAFCFILYEKHTNTNQATLAVAIIHALINSLPFFKNLYLHIFS